MSYEDTKQFKFVRDPKNGMIVGPDGCHYESEQEAVYFSQFGLCGCGRPNSVHKFLISCLEATNDDYPNILDANKIQSIIENNPDIVSEFVLHYLDSVSVVEHGGSVFGCWLTERGKQVLEIGVQQEETTE